METRLLIAGGGTGGHLFPGMAVAEEWTGRGPEMKVMFVGTSAGLESRHVPAAGWDFRAIRVRGLAGKGLADRIKGAALAPVGLLEAAQVVRSFKPHVALGVGGYVSGPAIAAAWLLGVPVAVQEQNAVPGSTNKILGRVAKKVFVTFEVSRREFAAADGKGRVTVAGNPVRRKIVEALTGGRREESDRVRLFITGGSLGAHALNELVPQAVALLKPETRSRLSVRHQTGEKDRSAVETAYRERGIEARVEAFVTDMAGAYLAADLVISRSGAGAVAEIALSGLPSILVPFPFAAADHQAVNAAALADAGAAVMLRQQGLTPERLAAEIGGLVDNPEVRRKMSAAARGVARPEAAKTVVDECLRLVG